MIKLIKMVKLKPNYIIISAATLFCGFLFYAFQHDIIIFRFPAKQANFVTNLNIQKKNFKLIYWHNNKWNYEEKEIIDSDNKIKTLTHLVTGWLQVLEEEQIIVKKVSIQSVLFDNSGKEAYISFDRNPLNKQSSTYMKLMLVEGLLKTIRENKFQLQNIYLLVHHKPLHDQHLDFSKPWPVIGFTNR